MAFTPCLNICSKHKLIDMLIEKMIVQTIRTAKTKYHTLKTACMSHVPSIPSDESSSYVIVLYLITIK